MNYYIILLALIATIIAILPLIFIKRYIINKKFYNLVIAFILYILLLLSYIKLFEKEELSSIYIILQILQIFLVLVVGVLMFNESINNNKIIGILLGSVSIYLLLKK
jgi:drug/metabolite transporter (DMT)-like permease